MNCDGARDSILLAAYGELPDGDAIALESHLKMCRECVSELNEVRRLAELMALNAVAEPDPNLVAQSRMRLDEALDAMPRNGVLTLLRANAGAWFGHVRSAPALVTLLVGLGFLGGNFAYRYQVAHEVKAPGPVILTDQNGGGVSTISGVKQLPGDMVQVSYNRMIPEMAEGSLDDPQIRKLLTVGTIAATTNVVQLDSVALLANECRIGHACRPEDDGDVRRALLTSLRTDKSPTVRMAALEGLQPYVSQDLRVRDAVAQALLTDASAAVRTKAITMLEPVQSDSSVRQALRTVAASDDNPYLRTVSTQALQGSSSIQ